jgi:plasmid stabilization system protein ParE
VIVAVRTTPEADAQIRAIDDWWRANRPTSPDLFLDELAAVFDLLPHAPQIGQLYRQSPVPSTRRILLRGTRYHVYNAPSVDQLRVLAVWHGAGSDHRCDHEGVSRHAATGAVSVGPLSGALLRLGRSTVRTDRSFWWMASPPGNERFFRGELRRSLPAA